MTRLLRVLAAPWSFHVDDVNLRAERDHVSLVHLALSPGHGHQPVGGDASHCRSDAHLFARPAARSIEVGLLFSSLFTKVALGRHRRWLKGA